MSGKSSITEEEEEIGAIIYDDAMQQKGVSEENPPRSQRSSVSVCDSAVSVQNLKTAVSEHEKRWNMCFNKLPEFRDESSGDYIPSGNSKMVWWIARQRQAYRKGELSQDRVDRLNEIGFNWTSSGNKGRKRVSKSNEQKWEARLNELIEYKSKHGHCNVNTGGKEGKLGDWVHTQRGQYRDGNISQDRVDRLNAIGFAWYAKGAPASEVWEERFNDLASHISQHGSCDGIPTKSQLWTWIRWQWYRYKIGKLSREHIDRLESIGLPLVSKLPKTPWGTRFDELVEYKSKHGDTDVPEGCGLGYWVRWQRQRFRRGELSQERVDRLDGIGFEWKRNGWMPSSNNANIGYELRPRKDNCVSGSCDCSDSSSPLPDDDESIHEEQRIFFSPVKHQLEALNRKKRKLHKKELWDDKPPKKRGPGCVRMYSKSGPHSTAIHQSRKIRAPSDLDPRPIRIGLHQRKLAAPSDLDARSMNNAGPNLSHLTPKRTSKKHELRSDDDSDVHEENVGITKRPSRQLLHFIRSLPPSKQRSSIVEGLRVKVRFSDNLWYGGMVASSLEQGSLIKIDFDDGTKEKCRFPDRDVIVDDVDNGRHRQGCLMNSSAFVPPG